MKQIDRMSYDENLSWCRPYISDRVQYTVTDGRISCMMIDGETYSTADEIASHIEAAARITVDDYDLYSGWTAEELLLSESNCKETGCLSCPYRDDCEAMQMEIEDPDNTYYFPDAEYADRIFGSAEPTCLTLREVERLSHEWGVNLLTQMHEATEDEIAEYGVMD